MSICHFKAYDKRGRWFAALARFFLCRSLEVQSNLRRQGPWGYIVRALNVDRKLYNAYLLVTLMAVKSRFVLKRSLWKMLSLPSDASKRLRGAMRCGFLSD